MSDDHACASCGAELAPVLQAFPSCDLLVHAAELRAVLGRALEKRDRPALMTYVGLTSALTLLMHIAPGGPP